MNGWKEDKRWSDRFIPQIKTILAQFLITESPPEEDQEHNTDLIVLTLKPFRVGCRIRKYKYIENYGDEFTIRSGRPSGCKTELTKIIEGWGDYFFYGFCDEQENKLQKYFLGNLNVFRLWFNQCLWACAAKDSPGTYKKNVDGSSYFRAFKLSNLPPEFIICQL